MLFARFDWFLNLGISSTIHLLAVSGGKKNGARTPFYWESNAKKHREVDTFCFVFCFVFAPLLSLWEEMNDDKDTKLLLASEICTDSCPWTVSVPRSSQLPGTDNILGQLSVHISSPKVVYCLYIHLLAASGAKHVVRNPFPQKLK